MRERAERLLLRRLTHRPQAARCWYRLGRVAHATERTAEARAHLDRALTLWRGADPTCRDLAEARGLLATVSTSAAAG